MKPMPPMSAARLIDFHRAFADALAVVLVAHVEAEVLDAGHVQIPLVKRLLVHGADVGEALLLEIQGQVAGDEAAGAGDDDQIVLLQRRVFFNESFCFHIFFSLVQWKLVIRREASFSNCSGKA